MNLKLAAMLLTFFLIVTGSANSAPENRIRFLQSENIVQQVGDSLIVNLSLDSGVQLVHGYRVRFSFDTTILRLDNISATPAWNAG
ncbi:MAG: hypothetical protein IPH75_11225, partial [bacterium]|nr:hypothetical protein [bacterium]